MTTHKAKQVIREFLDKEDLPYSKLTAKTVSFSDLARTSEIFVKVHGWQPSPAANDVKAVAHENGFRVEFSW